MFRSWTVSSSKRDDNGVSATLLVPTLPWYFGASGFPSSDRYTQKHMGRSTFSRVSVCALVVALTLSGCSRDPNVRKQKYFRSGEKYFQQGKYAEAAVQFLNATRVDPSFAAAHYQLGQSYLKMQQWSPAYQEFARAAELDPDNLQVHLDVTNL